MSELLQGVLFVSSVSGLIYKDYGAAGDIFCVIVEGERFYPMEVIKPIITMHSDSEGCIHCESGEVMPSAFNYCPYCNKKLRRR